LKAELETAESGRQRREVIPPPRRPTRGCANATDPVKETGELQLRAFG
jgi:hypothetical protein